METTAQFSDLNSYWLSCWQFLLVRLCIIPNHPSCYVAMYVPHSCMAVTTKSICQSSVSCAMWSCLTTSRCLIREYQVPISSTVCGRLRLWAWAMMTCVLCLVNKFLTKAMTCVPKKAARHWNGDIHCSGVATLELTLTKRSVSINLRLKSTYYHKGYIIKKQATSKRSEPRNEIGKEVG